MRNDSVVTVASTTPQDTIGAGYRRIAGGNSTCLDLSQRAQRRVLVDSMTRHLGLTPYRRRATPDST
jgi:hypothetical protein